MSSKHQYHHVIMSSCHHVIMSSCHRVVNELNAFQTGKIPKIAKMTKSMNVTEGRRVKVTCRSTGFPKPEMYWLKNGLLYEPEGNNTIKERK